MLQLLVLEPWITDSPPICFLLILVLPSEKLAMGMEGSGFTERDAAALSHCSSFHSSESRILSAYIWLHLQ